MQTLATLGDVGRVLLRILLGRVIHHRLLRWVVGRGHRWGEKASIMRLTSPGTRSLVWRGLAPKGTALPLGAPQILIGELMS